jgi:hypothetical protein
MEKKAVIKHCLKCLQTSGWPVLERPSYLIRIDGSHNKYLWILVLTRNDAVLLDLDFMIRDIWKGCGEHISTFTINGTKFSSSEDIEGHDLSVPLNLLISQGSSFSCEFNFDSKTLTLSVVGQSPVAPVKGPLCLIARNIQPDIPCRACGKMAEYHAANWDENSVPPFMCPDCVTKNAGDKDYGWVDEVLNRNKDRDVPHSGKDTAAPHIIDAQGSYLKKEILGFLKEEILLYGKERGIRALCIVIAFSTIMHGLFGRVVSEWDIGTVRTCLLKDMVETPAIPREREDEVVPAICRFLLYLHEAGHMLDAIGISKALLEAGPAYLALIAANEKERDLFAQTVLDLFIQQLTGKKSAMNQEFIEGYETRSVSYQNQGTSLYRTKEGATIVTDESTIRNTMIRLRCDEFCERFPDNTIAECCTLIVKELASHPASPLSKGDATLWSAAIVYLACQRRDLIRRGTAGAHIGEEIALFFATRLSSTRTKASSLKMYLHTTEG